jgi:hypothetical protein
VKEPPANDDDAQPPLDPRLPAPPGKLVNLSTVRRRRKGVVLDAADLAAQPSDPPPADPDPPTPPTSRSPALAPTEPPPPPSTPPVEAMPPPKDLIEELRERGAADDAAVEASTAAAKRIAQGSKPGERRDWSDVPPDIMYDALIKAWPDNVILHLWQKTPTDCSRGKIDCVPQSYIDLEDWVRERFADGSRGDFLVKFYNGSRFRGHIKISFGDDPYQREKYVARLNAMRALPAASQAAPAPVAPAPLPPFPGSSPMPPQENEAIKAYQQMLSSAEARASDERRRAEEDRRRADALERELREQRELLLKMQHQLQQPAPAAAAPVAVVPAHVGAAPVPAEGPPNIKLPPGDRWTWENGQWAIIRAVVPAPPPPAPAPAPQAAQPAYPAGMPTNVKLPPGARWTFDPTTGQWEILHAAPAAPVQPAAPAAAPARSGDDEDTTGFGALSGVARKMGAARNIVQQMAPILGMKISDDGAQPAAAPALPAAAAETPKPEEKKEAKTITVNGLDLLTDANGEVRDLDGIQLATAIPGIVDQVIKGLGVKNDMDRAAVKNAIEDEREKQRLEEEKEQRKLAAEREKLQLQKEQLALSERTLAMKERAARLAREEEERAARRAFAPPAPAVPARLNDSPHDDSPPRASPPAPAFTAAEDPPAPAPADEGYDI